MVNKVVLFQPMPKITKINVYEQLRYVFNYGSFITFSRHLFQKLSFYDHNNEALETHK